jgi:hypothetical protein
MADLFKLPDGSMHTVFDIKDMLELIGTYIGDDARRWLEEYLTEDDNLAAYAADLEKEVEVLRDHHHEVMNSLREQSEKIAGLICEEKIDRKALSTAAGRIGTITWREVNV